MRFMPALLIALAGAAWLARDVCALVRSWLQDRLAARLRAQPRGIVACERHEIWSDGVGRRSTASLVVTPPDPRCG
jgi:hypothetical protein